MTKSNEPAWVCQMPLSRCSNSLRRSSEHALLRPKVRVLLAALTAVETGSSAQSGSSTNVQRQAKRTQRSRQPARPLASHVLESQQTYTRRTGGETKELLQLPRRTDKGHPHPGLTSRKCGNLAYRGMPLQCGRDGTFGPNQLNSFCTAL